MSISVSTIVASASANENLPYSDAGSQRPATMSRTSSSPALPAETVAYPLFPRKGNGGQMVAGLTACALCEASE